MIKTYKIRLLPTEKQEQLLWKHVHTSRFVWNYCLNYLNKRFNGIEFIQAGRFYPSSKTCSCCGNIKKDLKLKDRVYKCDKCNLEIDRDYNASINLMNYSKA